MRSFLLEPFAKPYMARALGTVLLLAVLGGVVGVHVLLRRMAFVTEVVQHTVFPGVAVAFAVDGSLLAGALTAAAVAVVLLAVAHRRSDVDQESVMALLVAASFAVGVVVVSRRDGYQHDLTALLFGRVLAVDRQQLVETLVVAVICVVVVLAVHKELVLAAFDRQEAVALGYPVTRLDVVLNLVVALTVVAAVRAVGTVLVVAFLVTPAAAARFSTRHVAPMMVAATAFSALLGWVGLAVSYWASVRHDVPLAAGATVVLALTAGLVVVALVSALLRRRAAGPAVAR